MEYIIIMCYSWDTKCRTYFFMPQCFVRFYLFSSAKDMEVDIVKAKNITIKCFIYFFC